ncbi:PSD1 and planctomycete cytochrome C domain-containing protein [Emticicia sp. 17c]|uniref:PSD1 and planctomycete cytochrome C domain-containing protein n=1 Tax=Emticicia sp. 17c TaxID=3127704 RepID=UPI00301E54EC
MKTLTVKLKFYVILCLITVGIASIVWNCTRASAETTSMPDEVDYNFHIRPILSDRCFKCHGPDANKREANLRLDTPEGAFAALKDNPKGHALVAGNPEQSEMFLRIISKDSTLRMPPPSSNLKLSQYEIDLIEKWIKQGAKYKPHWAFIAPRKTRVPDADEDWTVNEIDNFVYDKMQQKGLDPNEEASKEQLLKRLSFDLTGLPPTVEMQEKFLKDTSPNTYEKVVDELLKNKHYGEKMATYWLDVARYADSHGYQDDGLRTMWPWRDWVIHAYNANYPYSKFLSWQLAGDLLPNPDGSTLPSKEMLLATGFNRNHKITQEGGVIDEEYRVEYVTDRTNTFGKAFLALTFECAKCHDHKYDPISQKDYYSTFAFFNQVPEKGLFGTIDASFADPPNMAITDADVKSLLNFINKRDTAKVMVMVMKDTSKVRTTYVLNRGNYDAHGDSVTFGLPKSILAYDTTKYGKGRLGLVKWMLDANNPLTARVFVNRIWAQFFGRGIVKTVGDFGMQGELPSHPELLDWLAVDFRENGWNVKRLVKQVVMSATYRQSSVITEKHLKTDPENIFLARASRIRLPAENVRDFVLASSDILNNEIGGPSVKPYQPKGLWEVATSGRGSLSRYVQDHESDLYRRGMYVFIKRTVPPPTMLIFDASNRDQCEVQRSRTNTPLQALVMMNDPQMVEGSRVMAESLMMEKSSVDEKLEKAFRKVLCRKPKEKEMAIIKQYFDSETSLLKKDAKKAEKILNIGEYKHLGVPDKTTTAALMQTIQMLYNMEEAIMRG